MPYRVIPSPPPPVETEFDSPEMVEAVVAVARNEQDIGMLSRLAEIGMELAEAQAAYAKARLAAVVGEGSALAAGEDPNAAFSKIAQTVRRIIALKVKMAEDVDKRGRGLSAERAARRAKRLEDHESAVKNAIDMALTEAFHADLPVRDLDPDADPLEPDPREVECREMLDDAELLLEDLDDYGDWLSGPVGETVAKLCVALGFDADMCVKRGDTWLVRRAATAFETLQTGRAGRPKAVYRDVQCTPPPRGDTDPP